MRWLHAWLTARAEAARLRKLWDKPGWVVMIDPATAEPPYHAMSGGSVFGMDEITGRFPDRDAAHAFARCRAEHARLENDPCEVYVTHESSTYRPLPENYLLNMGEEDENA